MLQRIFPSLPLTLLLSFTTLLCAFAGEETKKASITVKVVGLASDQGEVIMVLYDSKQGFPHCAEGSEPFKAKIKDGEARFHIPALKTGEYAVAVFHDENRNSSLDTNIIGIPKEGYGFSGPDRGRFARPDYDKSKLTLPEDGLNLTIAVHYIY